MYKEIEKEMATGMKRVFINLTSWTRRSPITVLLILIFLVAMGTGGYFIKANHDAQIARAKEQRKIEFLNKSREIAKFSPDEQEKVIKEIKDGIVSQIKLNDNQYAVDWEITYKDGGSKDTSAMTGSINGETFKLEDKTLFPFNEKVSANSNFNLQGKAQVFAKDQTNNNGISEQLQKVVKGILAAHIQNKEKEIEAIKPKE